MIKTKKQIEEKLEKKLKALEKEERLGMFPTTRAVLTGEVQTLEGVLGKGGRRFR